MNGATMPLDDVTNDGEPESGTSGAALTCLVEARETVEDPLAIVGCDAASVVVDIDDDGEPT